MPAVEDVSTRARSPLSRHHIIPRPSHKTSKAGGKRSHATFPVDNEKTTLNNSKVEKRRAKSQKPRKTMSPVLMQKFEAALNDTRDKILTWVEVNVRQTEAELTRILERLTHSVQDQLTFVGELEACIYTAVNQETLDIELSPSSPTGRRHLRRIDLADCVERARSSIDVERKALDILWRSWTQTQLELTCLSVEVLGEQDNALPATPQPEPLIMAALEDHRKLQQQYEQSKRRKTELRAQVKGLMTRTQARLNAQQKEWRLNKKKHLNDIQRAILHIQEYS